MDLHDLLVDLTGLSDAEADDLGRKLYKEIYLTHDHAGYIRDFNGETVVFHRDRYDHAFHTSADRIRSPYSKAKVARDRIARIRWILEVIQGRVSGAECFMVQPESGRKTPLDKMAVTLENGFVVWLQPMSDGRWKFSSAYETTVDDIYRYKRRSIRRVWIVP